MDQKIRQIVRIANTDIDGHKKLHNALRKIKGISFMFSNALCNHLQLDGEKQLGFVKEEDIKRIEGVLSNPSELPSWLLNRKKDNDTGKDRHLAAGQIKFVKDSDIKKLQEVKSYKGLRHAWGLPLRGQRTRSNFRKGKSVGVSKKSKEPAKKKAAPAGGKK